MSFDIHQIEAVLEQHKAYNVVTFDVKSTCSFTDAVIICTGSSTRHVRTLGDYVIQCLKDQGVRPYGVEGKEQYEWLLIDAGELVIHIMIASTREFYEIEKLMISSSKPDAFNEINR